MKGYSVRSTPSKPTIALRLFLQFKYYILSLPFADLTQIQLRQEQALPRFLPVTQDLKEFRLEEVRSVNLSNS